MRAFRGWGLVLASVLERVQGIAHLGRQLEVPVFAPPAGDFAQQRHNSLVNACPLCARVGDLPTSTSRTPGTFVLEQDAHLLVYALSIKPPRSYKHK